MPPPSATADVHRQVEPRIWRACAGSSVQIPAVHSSVYYFPQGHAEHSSSSSTLLSPLALSKPFVPCLLVAVHYLADPVTDEVFVRLVLQPVPPAQFSSVDLSRCGGGEEDDGDSKIMAFAKVLTPSDANNGGGFSVPRFCADSIFPPLDYHAERPVQTLSVTDVHGVACDFRHIYRGTPKRHLLTTGWSKFVNHKKLVAGDSIVFMKNLRGEMFVGVRRVIRSGNGGRGGSYGGDDFARWHDQSGGGFKEEDGGEVKGFCRSGKDKLTAEAVADAANRAAQGLPFEVVYYPRAGCSDFVVRAEVVEASLAAIWAPDIRVKMAMETEDSSRMTWFQGTISSTMVPERGSSLGSPWKMLQVSWDEPEILQNMERVSPWQVEIVAVPTPQLHATFPPTKRFKFSLHNSGFLSEVEEEIYFPTRGLSNSTLGNPNPSLLNYTTFPAGMQGARQNHFKSFSFTNFMGDNSPQMFTENSLGSTMIPGVHRVSTELNICSPHSDELSPNSQSSIHSSGTDPVGNRISNPTRGGISSFQLFGKIIRIQEPAETGHDDSGCIEEDESKGCTETEGSNKTLLSLTYGHPKQIDRLDIPIPPAVEACFL